MKKEAVAFGLAIATLSFMAYRHWGPALSTVDSSAYSLPVGSVRPAEELVGKLDVEAGAHHFTGATGFVVNFKTVTLILTAKHLFGPAGGMSELSPAEMTRDVKAVTVHAAEGGGAFTSTRALYLADTESSDDEPNSVSRDVAAMLVEQPVRALAFAATAPNAGDHVSVVLNDGTAVSAHVTESTPLRLAYHFDNKGVGLGSSGAPILNDSGEVVGVHLRFGRDTGSGNPTASIVPRLEKRIR
jgi:hypothetical protein